MLFNGPKPYCGMKEIKTNFHCLLKNYASLLRLWDHSHIYISSRKVFNDDVESSQFSYFERNCFKIPRCYHNSNSERCTLLQTRFPASVGMHFRADSSSITRKFRANRGSSTGKTALFQMKLSISSRYYSAKNFQFSSSYRWEEGSWNFTFFLGEFGIVFKIVVFFSRTVISFFSIAVAIWFFVILQAPNQFLIKFRKMNITTFMEKYCYNYQPTDFFCTFVFIEEQWETKLYISYSKNPI